MSLKAYAFLKLLARGEMTTKIHERSGFRKPIRCERVKKENSSHMSSYELCEIFLNSFFTKHLKESVSHLPIGIKQINTNINV